MLDFIRLHMHAAFFPSFIAGVPYVFVEQTYQVSESESVITVTIRREGSTDKEGHVGMYRYKRSPVRDCHFSSFCYERAPLTMVILVQMTE